MDKRKEAGRRPGMEKKDYEGPQLEVVRFEAEDVIVTSGESDPLSPEIPAQSL